MGGKRQRTDTDQLEPRAKRLKHKQRVAVSRFGMVATAHQRATDAGVWVLENGGNAVDAAVASALALGVCEPAASGLGGQTMMMIHDVGSRSTVALDGSSRAPHRATPGSLKAAERRRGHSSTTVPSTPATLAYALERYGSKKLDFVAQPAIELADRGFEVTELLHALTKREVRDLRAGTARAIFLKDERKPFRPGAVFRQPALAETLRGLAERGVEDFYTGRIARAIHDDMVRHDGLIREDDLAQIPWPIERRPLSCRFKSMRVVTFPPPGAGRTLVLMLNLLAQFSDKQRDPDSPEGAALLASVIRQAFRDRRDRPRDPNFYAQVEEKRMLSRDYAKATARSIRRELAGHGETTHLSVADRDGCMVALTQSIERVYGSCCASPELGFLYNDYMSAFEYEDISHPYYLRPNANPWASVAPTIVFRGRRPWLAIGSPGSERITPSILQVLLRLESSGPYEAVDAPRLHCAVDGKVSIESSRFEAAVVENLERHGFEVRDRDAYSFYLGCVQLVLRDRHGWIGVADPRRDGSAGGAPEMKLPLLISVPHAGLDVPAEVRPYCTLSARQIVEDGDEGAREIYDLADAVQAFVTTDVARAIVDLNRAEEDRGPDGVVKTHTCLGVPVYDSELPGRIVELLLEQYYRSYHRRLRSLAAGKVRLGIDCHTMLAIGPEIGPLAGEERPKICVSNLDGRSCPESWLESLATCLETSFGCEVARNHPFKGGHITRSHAGELPWMQLEISRAPFLPDEGKRERVLAAFRAFCNGMS